MEIRHTEESQPRKNENGVWNKYAPYWPVLVILLLLSVLPAWLYIQYKPAVYAAGTTILIKDKEKGGTEPEMVEELNPLAKKNSVENEMLLIKSLTIIAAVVDKLHMYAPVYAETKFVRTSAYQTSPVLVAVKHTDSIAPVDKVYFNYSTKSSRVSLDGTTYPLNCWVETPHGILQFIPNKYYKGQPVSAPLYFSLLEPEAVAMGLSTRLDASFLNKNASVVLLTIYEESPQLAKDFLNELVIAYNRAATEDQTKLSANTLAFIEERLKFVKNDLDSIEHRIQEFRADKNAVNIEQEGQLYLSNVNANDQKLGEISTKLAVLDQIQDYIISNDSSTAVLPSTLGLTNTAMSGLLSELHKQELEYATLKRTVSRNNPMLTSIKDQIDLIKPALIENIKNQRKDLQINKNYLTQASGEYNSQLRNIPQKERTLIDIKREQNIKDNIYSFLLQKREETALSYVAAVPQIKIVDKAMAWVSTTDASGGKAYLIAAAIAFALFIAIVYLKEGLNRSVLYKHEIEGYTSLPLIGEIIYDKSTGALAVSAEKHTIISQQFKKLRASLNFLGIDDRRKKLLVTSFISGEGKSFITANLGTSIALTGKRVVLLEMDLSNPALSEKFGISRGYGISDYLLGKAGASELAVQTSIHQNLFVIPSGKLEDKTSELIMSGKVKTLLHELESLFDCIIVDTAPIGPTPDAYTLSSFCDATLFVIRHNYTPKALVKKIDDEMRINPLKNVGIVFNGVQSRGFTSNNTALGYIYNYTYGGSANKKNKQLVVRKRSL